jgi:molybdopterin/thiamine biosynthesis adenylyltransferase
MIGSGAIGC